MPTLALKEGLLARAHVCNHKACLAGHEILFMVIELTVLFLFGVEKPSCASSSSECRECTVPFWLSAFACHTQCQIIIS